MRSKKPNTSSKYRGVSKTKYGWNARVKYKGKLYLIGSFIGEKDAAQAYNDFIELNNFPHPVNVI